MPEAAWFETIPYPQLAMAGDGDLSPIWSVAEARNHIREQWGDVGFHGSHIALQWRRPQPGHLYLAEQAGIAGKILELWFFGDRQGGTAPDDINTPAARRHMDEVISDLEAMMPVAWTGQGTIWHAAYDANEHLDTDEVAQWVAWMRQRLPRAHVGQRAEKAEDSNTYRDLAGTYRSFGLQVTDRATYPQQLQSLIPQANGLPRESGDRYRVNRGRPKDPPTGAVVTMLNQTIDAGFAATWGMTDGTSPVRGSLPWPEQLIPGMRAALGLAPPAPPDQEDEMPYLLRTHRTISLEITPGEWDTYVTEDDDNLAVREGSINNSQPWIIHAVDFFCGILTEQWDEYTVTAAVQDENGNWRSLAEHITEKDDPSSGFAAGSRQNIALVQIQRNATLRIKVRHSNLANAPHGKITLRGYWVPGD